MSNTPVTSEPEQLKVNRGRVMSINLYEIKEDELDLLERGSPASIQFNLALSAVTFVASTYITMRSGQFTADDRLLFTLVMVIAGLFGVFCGAMWLWTRSSNKALCETIRRRISTTAIPLSDGMADESVPDDLTAVPKG